MLSNANELVTALLCILRAYALAKDVIVEVSGSNNVE
jgi:hypothetical protein